MLALDGLPGRDGQSSGFPHRQRLPGSGDQPLDDHGILLHLAVGRHLRGSLSTMDKGLASAGQEVGLTVELIEA
jgi:hypothetical protein